jgi:hypothetical protein
VAEAAELLDEAPAVGLTAAVDTALLLAALMLLVAAVVLL